jgi:hypothetical protein
MITIDNLEKEFLLKVLEHYNIHIPNYSSKRDLFILFKNLFLNNYDIFTIEELICVGKLVGDMNIMNNNKKLLGKYISENIIITNKDMIHSQTALPYDIANIINDYDIDRYDMYKTIFNKTEEPSRFKQYKITSQGIPYIYKIYGKDPNDMDALIMKWKLPKKYMVVPGFIGQLMDYLDINVLPLLNDYTLFDGKGDTLHDINLKYFRMKPKLISETNKITINQRVKFPYKGMKLINKFKWNLEGIELSLDEISFKLYIYEHKQKTIFRLEVFSFINSDDLIYDEYNDDETGGKTSSRKNYFFELIQV